jgi:hypothetical protein
MPHENGLTHYYWRRAGASNYVHVIVLRATPRNDYVV